MPLYVYICDNPCCGHTLEVLQSMVKHAEDPYSYCPKCGALGVLMPQVTAPARTPGRWGDTNRI